MKCATKNEVKNALGYIVCNKTPRNHGLTSEFYKGFWSELKTPLLLFYIKSFLSGELSISQKQAVIKLIGKKDRDKRLIKNWRPISLLKIDARLISKVLAKRSKKHLPSLISSNQTVYVDKRIIYVTEVD